jgi:hypothetical protein
VKEGEDGGPGAPPPDENWRESVFTLAIYIVAVIAYAVAGMYWHFLLSWTRGVLFAVIAVWLLPGSIGGAGGWSPTM